MAGQAGRGAGAAHEINCGLIHVLSARCFTRCLRMGSYAGFGGRPPTSYFPGAGTPIPPAPAPAVLFMEAQIILAVIAALTGKIETPQQPDRCLAFARIVVEHAYGMRPFEFYERFGVRRTSAAASWRSDWTFWAADIEASLRQLKLGVPYHERRPGDLLFSHRTAAPYGHVGVLLSRELVAESIVSEWRPHSLNVSPFLSVTPISQLDATFLARLPEEL